MDRATKPATFGICCYNRRTVWLAVLMLLWSVGDLCWTRYDVLQNDDRVKITDVRSEMG